MDDICKVSNTNEQVLNCVIGLLFEKTVMEPKYCTLYASLARKLSEHRAGLKEKGKVGIPPRPPFYFSLFFILLLLLLLLGVSFFSLFFFLTISIPLFLSFSFSLPTEL